MNKVTQEEYGALVPFNKMYGKWLNDLVSARRIYYPFAKYFDDWAFQFYQRNHELLFTAPHIEQVRQEDVIAALQQDAYTVTDNTTGRRFKVQLESKSQPSQVEGMDVLDGGIRKLLFEQMMFDDNDQTTVMILSKSKNAEGEGDTPRYRFYVVNPRGTNPSVTDVLYNETHDYDIDDRVFHQIAPDDVPNFNQVQEVILAMAAHTPQIEFFAVDVQLLPEENSFIIVQMHGEPPYPVVDGFSAEATAYLLDRLFFIQREDIQEAMTIEFQSKFVRAHEVNKHFPRGFYPFLETAVEEKLHRLPDFDEEITANNWKEGRGFLAHRTEQYGITYENHETFISDFEYEYLGHINNKYRGWLEDKLTIKYLLHGFNQYLPEYYYLISNRSGVSSILPLMDCPSNLSTGFDGLLELVRQKGILALKPDEGTHGLGFFKFTYSDGNYYLNGEMVNETQLSLLFEDVHSRYVVTEFITQHETLSNIFPDSVNTARVTVFKKDGRTAQIGNAYLRFGTNQTNGVDNIGAGGIGVELDVETGTFKHAVLGVDELGHFIPCENHPDTNVPITGVLPHWEEAKAAILDMANTLTELEYMGFDVAFTPEGIKLPEINRFPDFPKINKLSRETMDYLLEKLALKKKMYGYDKDAPFLTEEEIGVQ